MTAELIGVWISALLTLAIFSFLYKDNPIYKFAEHLFVGVSAGYTFIQAITGTLIPNLIDPLRKAASGTDASGWFRLGALLLGFMMLLRLVEKTRWISRWPLALMVGTFAALRMLGHAQSDLVKQINGTMIPLWGAGLPWLLWEGASIVNHIILIVGVLSVLIYFFFSLEQKTPLKQVGYVGTFFLMVTFGSSFGYTVLGRVSLLIGRVQDLYLFSEARYHYASLICSVAVTGFLVVWEIFNRRKGKRGQSDQTG